MVLVDSNIILDIWDSDPVWAQWSRNQLSHLSPGHEMAINPVIYAETASRYSTHVKLDEAIEKLGFDVLPLPREAAFLAGKAFLQYRKQGGVKLNVLPDFFIGAHAAVLGASILTRDTGRYATYFPAVHLIAP